MKALLNTRPAHLVMTALSLLLATQAALASPLLASDLASFTVLGASTVTNVQNSVVVGNT